MKNFRKIYIPQAQGFIYVEKYHDKNNEEENRSKIYDSNWEYLDYLDTEFITEKEYNNILLQLIRAKSDVDFIENILFYNTYDCGDSAIDVIDSIHDNEYVGYEDYNDCKKIIDELKNDYKTLSDKELCKKYDVNRVGNWYIFLGDC